MPDDLLSALLGCGCRARCCCEKPPEPAAPGGNLFQTKGKGTPFIPPPDDPPFIPPRRQVRALPPGAPGWASMQVNTDYVQADNPLAWTSAWWRWPLVVWDLGATQNAGSITLSYTDAQQVAWFGQTTRFERPEAGSLTTDGRVMLFGQVSDWNGSAWVTRPGQAWAVLPRPGADGSASWGHIPAPDLQRAGHTLIASAATAISVTPDRILKVTIPRYQPDGDGSGTVLPPFFDSAVIYEATPAGGAVGVHGLTRAEGLWAHAGHTWDADGTIHLPMRSGVESPPGTVTWTPAGWITVTPAGAGWGERPAPAQVISDRDVVTGARYLTGDAVPDEAILRTQYPTLHGWLESPGDLSSTMSVTVPRVARVENGYLLYGEFGIQPWNAGYTVGDFVLTPLGTHPDVILVSTLPASVQAALRADPPTPITVTRVPTTRYWASAQSTGDGTIGTLRLNPPILDERPISFAEHPVTLDGGTWASGTRPRSDPLTSPRLPNPGAALVMPAGASVGATVTTPAPFGPYTTLLVGAQVHPKAALFFAGKELTGKAGQFVQQAAPLDVPPAYVSAQPRMSGLPETRVNVAQARAATYTVTP